MAIDNGTVLVLITVLVLPVAAVAFARSGGAWQRIGKGDFAIEQETAPRRRAAGPRRARRAGGGGEADAGGEVLPAPARRRGPARRRLGAQEAARRAGDGPPSVDEELREEVRRLVLAGNERRLRRGEEPLDVEAETERQLSDFVGSG